MSALLYFVHSFREQAAVARRYRNRRISEFLEELRLTDERGTVIPKILRAMDSNGPPDPEFETDEERTYFTVAQPGTGADNRHHNKKIPSYPRDPFCAFEELAPVGSSGVLGSLLIHDGRS